MIMTVCRRTRASRQIFSRPLHSLGVAAEVTEAPTGWQEEAVLFSVPPEGLSILESHRTSQHSASLSDGWSPKRPEKEKTLDEKAEVPLLCTCIYNRGSLVAGVLTADITDIPTVFCIPLFCCTISCSHAHMEGQKEPNQK